MRRITKDEVPSFWSDFQKKNPNVIYIDLKNTPTGAELKTKLRAHMVNHQQQICAYCSQRIDMLNSHNEHIRPKDSYPQLSMEYNNLLASCTSQEADKTCGMNKGSRYDESLFISPLQENCSEHFRFLDDGQIEGVTNSGKYTIDLLNLNCYSLRQARRALLHELRDASKYCGKKYIHDYYIAPQDNQLPRFVDMTTYFYNRGDFDVNIEQD